MKLSWTGILIGLATIIIAGFQVYWLRDNYRREEVNLDQRAQILFFETVRSMQDSVIQLRLMNAIADTGKSKDRIVAGRTVRGQFESRPAIHAPRVLNMLGSTLRRDSSGKGPNGGIFITVKAGAVRDSGLSQNLENLRPEDIESVHVVKSRSGADSIKRILRDSFRLGNARPQLSATTADTSVRIRTTYNNTILYNNDRGERIVIQIDSLFQDSVSIADIEREYKKVLKREGLVVPFTISKLNPDSIQRQFVLARGQVPNPPGFRLSLENTFPYIIKKLTLPIVFSIFLVGLTVATFLIIYRNMLRQRRLAEIKNEFISNITHELKTPIATVGVAIEALKNFNAIQDQEKTAEYLDISQHELSRLSLLVEKVLKLSMFENQQMDLRFESVDLGLVVEEVISSLRLQSEKLGAKFNFTTEGHLNLEGDRMHLVSVVFNLLDNALKYSNSTPVIRVQILEKENEIEMIVADNGIGIPVEYREKVFDKFFRVPSGNTHNAKGHGLGLSYVAKVVHEHGGTIAVSASASEASIFTVILPKKHV